MSADAFGEPVVATHGAADPSGPLAVLLHGRIGRPGPSLSGTRVQLCHTASS